MTEPGTLQDLIDWFEDAFVCLMAPSRAFIEIPTSKTDVARFIFQTYAVQTEATPDAEGRLVREMYRQFSGVFEDRPDAVNTLIWRLPEKIKIEHETRPVLGKKVATAEEIADGAPEPRLPDHYRDSFGDYYELDGYIKVVSIRTRLFIPALEFMDRNPLCSHCVEGGVVLRV